MLGCVGASIPKPAVTHRLMFFTISKYLYLRTKIRNLFSLGEYCKKSKSKINKLLLNCSGFRYWNEIWNFSDFYYIFLMVELNITYFCTFFRVFFSKIKRDPSFATMLFVHLRALQFVKEKRYKLYKLFTSYMYSFCVKLTKKLHKFTSTNKDIWYLK